MTIEQKIFNRRRFYRDMLVLYGFKKTKAGFVYQKNVMQKAFRIVVTVDHRLCVTGRVIDLDLNEEYTGFRVEPPMGSFAVAVRQEFETLLNDIKLRCTDPQYFISAQANRISDQIFSTYHGVPEFLWRRFPGYGVFRNENTRKWYTVIMAVSKSKLDQSIQEDSSVEIINLKPDECHMKQLSEQKGVYPAYHMNKKNWISIVLDETVPDACILTCLNESYRFSDKIY